MSRPDREIELHNGSTIDDLGGGCYLTIPRHDSIPRSYYQPGVHEIRGGTRGP